MSLRVDNLLGSRDRHRARSADATFLPWDQIPPNLLRLRQDEEVVPQVWRPVYRVGYRLRADDHLDEAAALLADPGVNAALSTLNRALRDAGAKDPNLIGAIVHAQGLHMAVARGLTQARRFGGPDRGILVLPDPALPSPMRRYTVSSTRCVRVGVRFPSSGSGEDYEDGGLHPVKTVVLLTLREARGEFISGDFRRPSPEEGEKPRVK